MPRRPIEDAEQRLLAAALSLFSRYGIERVNSNAIARRAGLGVGTFYSHFEDKYAVLQAIELRTLSGLREARRSAVEGVAGADPILQAEATIRAAVEFGADHPQAYRVSLGRSRSVATSRRPIVSESSRPTANALRALQAENRIDPTLDVDLAARVYVASEVGTILWWLEDTARAEAVRVIATLLRLHPIVACGVPRSSPNAKHRAR